MRESELGLRQTMLQALREVEDARANLVSSDEATRRLGSALAASDKALGLANQLYKGGATDFLDVLSAQEVYLRDSDSLNQVKREHALAAVALYRSLGVGGAGMTRRVGRRWRRWRELSAITMRRRLPRLPAPARQPHDPRHLTDDNAIR